MTRFLSVCEVFGNLEKLTRSKYAFEREDLMRSILDRLGPDYKLEGAVQELLIAVGCVRESDALVMVIDRWRESQKLTALVGNESSYFNEWLVRGLCGWFLAQLTETPETPQTEPRDGVVLESEAPAPAAAQ